ncbi:MAG: HEAT repeat domain-containing protein [Bdellovibrionales bacterium]|nr:HEAT repeat domain-containing protein [Bdellovibrionales bacterium]
MLILLASSLFLASACSDPEIEIPKLIKQLKSSDSSARNNAAMKLGSYGGDAQSAVRPLASLLNDENGGVRSSAAFALRKIGTPEAKRALDNYKK